MQLTANAFRSIRPRTLLPVLEVALVVALAGQAARLTWSLAAPPGPLGTPPVAAPVRDSGPDLSILAEFDPFFRVAGGETAMAETPSAAGGLVLYGVRVGGRGQGSAILGSGDRQQVYGVGDEVEPGLVLASVASDHVVLSRGAARRRVGFPKPAPGSAVLPMAATSAAPSTATPIDPARLLEQASLVPRLQDGRPNGYQLVPRGGGELLAAVGLQRGDVLLAVDGVALSPERVSQLAQELTRGAEIRFERGGQVMTTRIGTAP